MYVALTRARKSLVPALSARERMVNGSFESMRPSRFLKEMPADLPRELRAVLAPLRCRRSRFAQTARVGA
jgi:superfamily I DNA/RNA helicase